MLSKLFYIDIVRTWSVLTGVLVAIVDLKGEHILFLAYRSNSLPNKKILDWPKLNAFADNKTDVNEKFKLCLGRVENIVGKGENAGYQHFLLILQCFQKPSVSGSLKVGIVW